MLPSHFDTEGLAVHRVQVRLLDELEKKGYGPFEPVRPQQWSDESSAPPIDLERLRYLADVSVASSRCLELLNESVPTEERVRQMSTIRNQVPIEEWDRLYHLVLTYKSWNRTWQRLIMDRMSGK
jgi:hypothetical protein